MPTGFMWSLVIFHILSITYFRISSLFTLPNILMMQNLKNDRNPGTQVLI